MGDAKMDREIRRARRYGRGALIRSACAMAVCLIPLTFPVASGAFSGSTLDDSNSVSSAEVEPPSGFAATQVCAAGAAPAFRASSTATGVDSLTLPTPTGTHAGDVLVAQVSNHYSANNLDVPTGWNLVRRDTGDLLVTSAVYWRVATSSEPASATFSISGSPGVQMVGGIAAYSGVSTSSPVDVSGVIGDDTPTVTVPSVTTTVADAMLVFAVAKVEEVVAAPTGATQRWGLVSGTGTTSVGATAADESFPGPGATGERSITTSTSKSWVAHTVALRPALTTPSASLTWTTSPSAWASGYRLERVVGSTVEATQTVTPVSASSTTDGPLANGTAYSFRLWAYHGTWSSPVVTATLTPSC